MICTILVSLSHKMEIFTIYSNPKTLKQSKYSDIVPPSYFLDVSTWIMDF